MGVQVSEFSMFASMIIGNMSLLFLAVLFIGWHYMHQINVSKFLHDISWCVIVSQINYRASCLTKFKEIPKISQLIFTLMPIQYRSDHVMHSKWNTLRLPWVSVHLVCDVEDSEAWSSWQLTWWYNQITRNTLILNWPGFMFISQVFWKTLIWWARAFGICEIQWYTLFIYICAVMSTCVRTDSHKNLIITWDWP